METKEIKNLKTQFNKALRKKDYSHAGLTRIKRIADKIIKLRSRK